MLKLHFDRFSLASTHLPARTPIDLRATTAQVSWALHEW